MNELSRKLDDLTTAVMNMKEQTTLFYKDQTNLRKVNNQLSDDISHLRSELTTLQQDHNHLREKHTKLKEKHSKLQTSCAAFQERHRNVFQTLAEIRLYLDAFQADHGKLLKEQGDLKKTNDGLTVEMDSIKREQKCQRSQAVILQKQQTDTGIDMTSVRQDIASMHRQGNDLEKELATMKDEVVSILKHFVELDKETTSVRGKLPSMHKQITAVTKNMTSLKEKVTSVQTQQSDFDKTMREGLASVQTHQNETEKEVTSMKQEMTSWIRDLTELKDSNATQQLRTELCNLQAEMNDHLTPRHNLEARIANLREDLDHLQEKDAQRQQHFTQLATDLQNMNTEISADMDTIGTDQKMAQSRIEKLERSAQNAEVETTIADICYQQEKGSVMSKIGALKAEMMTSMEELLSKTSSAITGLETRLGQTTQLFRASGLDKQATSQGKAMIFRTVTVNEGGHYDSRTGVFTAPRSGLYCFTASVENCSNEFTTYGRIMVGEDLRCVIQGGYCGGSGCVLVTLTAGQKVWLRAYSAIRRYGSSVFYSSFAGMLVLPSAG